MLLYDSKCKHTALKKKICFNKSKKKLKNKYHWHCDMHQVNLNYLSQDSAAFSTSCAT